MLAGATRALIERAHELDVVGDAIGVAVSGEGRMVVVEGPPGIGKSRVLDAARELALGTEMRVLAARGHALEREFGFGVARQLFDRALAEAMQDEQPLSGPAAQAGLLLNGRAL